MPGSGDGFSKTTAHTLARRVNYHCSNPDCRRGTAGPRTDPARAVSIGQAAHITAAAPGGPRYDPSLTARQRSHPDNGIWLCANCHKLVDSDPERYTVELLRAWKAQAEEAARQEVERRAPGPPEPAAPVLSTPFNLPGDLADFTGRQADIDRVRECLSREGAVALSGIHGMGGIGKTALAVHVAHQLVAEGRFRDAQLYLNLKGSGPAPLDPAAALAAVAGPDPRRPQELDALAALWRAAMRGRDALLLLDDAADASQVRPLLPGCATCAVLVTSRRRFTLPGLARLDLECMEPGHARALLQALAPRLAAAEADEIAGLCGRLPLALRIAGNYLALNDGVTDGGYAALLADERERLSRLRDAGDPDLDVEAAMGLSVEQLDAEMRQAWALLSLFPAPFDVPAAAALWEVPEGAALERLLALRNRSLVSFDAATGRYEQHDLLRLAAGRLLGAGAGPLEPSSAPGEPSAARDRLARHYRAVARRVGEAQRYRDLDPDWPHLRAALDHAAEANIDLLSDLVYALSPYLSARGLAREWADWCRRAAMACAGAGHRRGEGNHLGNLGSAYRALGDARRAVEYHEQALAIAQEIGDRREEGADLGSLGSAYRALGEVQRAVEYYEQALAIAREIGDRAGEGRHSWNLGLLLEQSDPARAAELMAVLVAYETEIGHPDAEADARRVAEVRARAGKGGRG